MLHPEQSVEREHVSIMSSVKKNRVFLATVWTFTLGTHCWAWPPLPEAASTPKICFRASWQTFEHLLKDWGHHLIPHFNWLIVAVHKLLILCF